MQRLQRAWVFEMADARLRELNHIEFDKTAIYNLRIDKYRRRNYEIFGERPPEFFAGRLPPWFWGNYGRLERTRELRYTRTMLTNIGKPTNIGIQRTISSVEESIRGTNEGNYQVSLPLVCSHRRIVCVMTKFMVGIEDLHAVGTVSMRLSQLFLTNSVLQMILQRNYVSNVKRAGLVPSQMNEMLRRTGSIVAGSFVLQCITGDVAFQ